MKSSILFLVLLPILGFTQGNTMDSNNITTMQANETFRFFDDKGIEYSYPKKDYGENILPNKLAKVWDNADSLYGLLTMSLTDGFNTELIKAGQRLISIDKDTSRAYTILGIIYLKSDQLEKAEQTLLQGMKLSYNHAQLKTNLAKVYAKEGLTEKSYNTLWEAIELDPNQDNAIMWIGAIHNEKGGKDEYLNIMRKIAGIPSSWRAQLLIARDFLDRNDNEAAIKMYKEILPKVINEADAMMMISGDLGKHGMSREVMTMIYPHYDINKQDFRTGLNIINACLVTGNKTIGFAVLNEIKALNRHDLTSHLISLENRLNQIKE